jgi:tetratricopeptide (TPR) repeat protein
MSSKAGSVVKCGKDIPTKSTKKVQSLWVSLVFLIVLSIVIPVEASWWKKAVGIVGGVVAAPVKAVGWVVGQGVKSAVDPALDGAFARMRDTTDYAAKEFNSVAQQNIAQLNKDETDRITQLDDVAATRINQIDTLMGKRLDQVNDILNDKIQQVNTLADHVLDRQAAILDNNLSRESAILDKNVAALDQLSDKTLDRLNDIQNDAFDRVDSALQDQVPFAASQTAWEIVVAGVVLAFLIVLVGAFGMQLLKGVPQQVRNTRGSARDLDSIFKCTIQSLWANLGQAVKSMVVVAPAMLVIACVVLLAYWLYFNTANNRRIAKLENAAISFERIGEYRTAMSFRRRAFSLGPNANRQYWISRNEILAGFAQGYERVSPIELWREINQLRTTQATLASADGDLESLRIYLTGRYFGAFTVVGAGVPATQPSQQLIVGPNGAPLAWSQLISNFKASFLGGSPQDLPALGYLVLMTDLRMQLDDSGTPVPTRIQTAAAITDQLVNLYPKYAVGFLLRAELKSTTIDADEYRATAQSSPSFDGVKLRNDVEQDLEKVTSLDPLLMRYAYLCCTEMPRDAVDSITKLISVESTKRSADDTTAAQKSVKQYAEGLRASAQEVFQWQELADIEVEQATARAIRRDVGERKLLDLATEARAMLTGNDPATVQFDKCLEVGQAAIQIDRPDIAQIWIDSATQVESLRPNAITADEKQRISALQIDVTNTPLTPLLVTS